MAKKTTKKQQVTETKNKASVEKAGSIQLDKALSAISTASMNVQGTLSKVGEDLISKYSELQAVDESIALRKQELEALHGADKILLTIDELRVEHQTTLEQLEKERTEIIAAEAELRRNLEQERTRQDAEYKYVIQQNRKADSDAWGETVRIRQRDESIHKEVFERQIVDRELVLKTREVEYQAALGKALTFDAEVDKKVKEETAIALNSMRKEYTHQIAMTAVKQESEVQLLKTDNSRLQTTVAELQQQTRDLQAQLRAAQEAQTQLAKETVAAASNAKAQSDALALMTNIGGGNGSNRPRS